MEIEPTFTDRKSVVLSIDHQACYHTKITDAENKITYRMLDGLGRLNSARETLGSVTCDHTYTYDMRSQLHKSRIIKDPDGNPPTEIWNEKYTYDLAGNVIATMDIEDSVPDDTFDYLDEDQSYIKTDLLWKITGTEKYTLDWDLKGNMGAKDDDDSADDKSFAYNWDNKLQNATYDGGTLSVIYDPDGNRVSRTVNTTETKYIVDTVGGLPTIICEIESGSLTKSYVYANAQPLAMHVGDYVANPTTTPRYFYLHDRLGSVRMVINQSAETENTYTYNPFGEDIETTGSLDNPWKFTGQYHDKEIGQYYLRARQYDPHTARFTGRDPITGEFKEPMTLHAYLYCLNDPVDRLDPLGEASVSKEEVAGTTATGATVDSATGNNAWRLGQEMITRLNMSLSQYYLRFQDVYRTFAQRSGKAAEASVRSAFQNLGQYHEQVRVTINGKLRILDVISGNQLIEVKNVARINYVSSQLHDYLAYADKMGYQFNIFVRQSTVVANSVIKWAAENGVNIEYVFDKL